MTSPRGRALPGDRHVPLRDGVAARPRGPRPSTALTLSLVVCSANQRARRLPATMRACFQTISGGGPALHGGWAGSSHGWCLGLSISAARGGPGRGLVPGAVNHRGGRGPRVMRKRGGPAPVVAVEGGWPRRLRWVSLFGPRFASVCGRGGPAGGALDNGSESPRRRLSGLRWRRPSLPRAPGAAPARPGAALRGWPRLWRLCRLCTLGRLPSVPGLGRALRKGTGPVAQLVRCGGSGSLRASRERGHGGRTGTGAAL